MGLEGMAVNETSNGIEVSLPQSGHGGNEILAEERDPAETRSIREPVISIKDQLRQRQRVHRSQFSVALSALDQSTSFSGAGAGSAEKSNGSSHSGRKASFGGGDNASWRPKGHRIPLLGVTPAEAAFSDTWHLLQSSRVVDERSAVQQELTHLNDEIQALERDRNWLERSLKTSLTASLSRSSTGNSNNKHQLSEPVSLGLQTTSLSFLTAAFLGTVGSPDTARGGALGEEGIATNSSGCSTVVDWDVYTLLREDANKQNLLQPAERAAYQRLRGNSMTVNLNNPRTQEMFVQKCGGKLHHIQRTRLFKDDDSIITLTPNNCRPQGAATTLQQVNLMAMDGYPTTHSTTLNNSNNGFFVSRDAGKSASWGRIPNKLFRRMKEEGERQTTGTIGDLCYLSTGPQGCYYAEFQSGECWWGSAVEDPEFHQILLSWDVYRVAFGPIESLVVEEDTDDRGRRESNGRMIASNSWIILSRDGRAAWKNLPSRLSNRLQDRLADRAAPVEVSLGPGDSYFVRFLDGSVDYCLPAKVARVCERIEKRGGSITNLCLHPNISHDFVIRHTELTR